MCKKTSKVKYDKREVGLVVSVQLMKLTVKEDGKCTKVGYKVE